MEEANPILPTEQNIKEEIKSVQDLEENKKASLNFPQEKVLEARKEKILRAIKNNKNWFYYILLAIVVFLAVRIRTRNLPGLRDIVTGGWTLGPDLDPFLFLRWTKYIVEHGSLYAIDNMRYVPLGLETKSELLLHPYLMAWFHKLASLFGSTSVEQSSVLYPVFMFALTVIAFFFMTRKIFLSSLGHKNASIIALISSFFLSVTPILLARTIAGIPEKESAAFLFLFLGFYFFLSAWKAKLMKYQLSLALLAGISTAAMALVWGGFAYLFLTLGIIMFMNFLLGQLNNKKLYIYLVWISSSLLLMFIFSSRYSSFRILKSVILLLPMTIFLVVIVDFLIFKTRLQKLLKNRLLSKIPPRIISLFFGIILGIILSSIFISPTFVSDRITGINRVLIAPIEDRLGVTVAENRQPFFLEWAGNFGPAINLPFFFGPSINFPVFFWLFFLGSIYLFYHLISIFTKKERIILSLSYTILLLSAVFGRYSSESILNGTSQLSKIVYALGFLIFLGTLAFYYYKYHKEGKSDSLKKIDIGFILVLAFFFLSIISARGAIRLVLLLVPPTSIIVSYFLVSSFNEARKIKDIIKKSIAFALVIIIFSLTIYSGYNFYISINSGAQGYVPSIYTQQWQKAMSWVRENTPENAVFAHWWDYGYWVQTIGERATILDGGNVISYWNYFMGRHVLTGTENQDALEFLYAHNATHLLIDSSEIGKYSAFSLIGSNTSFDRASFIPTILRDDSLTQQKENSSLFVYQGSAFGIDEDINYEENGTTMHFPHQGTLVVGVIIEAEYSKEEINQPKVVLLYNNQQHTLPLRYAYDKRFIDFGSGLEEGVFLYPYFDAEANQLYQDKALLYLKKRTVKSQLARLYLYNEQNPYFKLVHSEDDFLIGQIKAQNPSFDSDFLYYQGTRGPIRIWEVSYPTNIQLNEEYLETKYPEELQIP